MRSLGMRSLGMTVRARPPRCGGVMARLAVAHLIVAGIDPAPLLREAGLTVAQIEAVDAEIAADCQVALLNLAADALNDDLLGFHLAEEFELRLVDLLYFVIATSATLGEALNQMARYNSIANEKLVTQLGARKGIEGPLQLCGRRAPFRSAPD